MVVLLVGALLLIFVLIVMTEVEQSKIDRDRELRRKNRKKMSVDNKVGNSYK